MCRPLYASASFGFVISLPMGYSRGERRNALVDQNLVGTVGRCTAGPRRWHAIGVAGIVVLLGVTAFQPITTATLPLLTVLSIACGIT